MMADFAVSGVADPVETLGALGVGAACAPAAVTQTATANAARQGQNQSPSKQKAGPEKAKRKPWGNLWSLDYSLESG